MDKFARTAALKQLEDKAARQALALEATHAMIDLLRSAPVDKETPKK